MYVSIAEVSDAGEETLAAQAALHATLQPLAGFRWSMLLRSLEDGSRLLAVSMWLNPAQAPASDAARDYDVATARGSMTPATHVALVDWTVESAPAEFVSRWNAAYHAIEDRIGSRLLQDLEQANRYLGLHAVTDQTNLSPQTLAAPVSLGEGQAATPSSVERFEVVLLTEA